MNDKEILKKLREDSLYRSILSQARTNDERQLISSTVESFVADLMSKLVPGIAGAMEELSKQESKKEDKSDEGVVIVGPQE